MFCLCRIGLKIIFESIPCSYEDNREKHLQEIKPRNTVHWLQIGISATIRPWSLVFAFPNRARNSPHESPWKWLKQIQDSSAQMAHLFPSFHSCSLCPFVFVFHLDICFQSLKWENGNITHGMAIIPPCHNPITDPIFHKPL